MNFNVSFEENDKSFDVNFQNGNNSFNVNFENAVIVDDNDAVKSVNGILPDEDGNVTLVIPDCKVESVNGYTGDVVLTAEDVGALPKDTVIPSIEGLATETYVDNAVNNIEIPEVDLTPYAKKEDIPSIEGLASEDYVKEAIANIEVPEGEAVNPDWEQNDPTAKDYIKNRPFYAGKPEETIYYDVIVNIEGGWGDLGSIPNFIKGSAYLVNFDDVIYECVYDGEVLGSYDLWCGVIIEGDFPFCVDYDGAVGATTDGEHAIKIYSIESELYKLDKKYLPFSINQCSNKNSVKTSLEELNIVSYKNDSFITLFIDENGFLDINVGASYQNVLSNYVITNGSMRYPSSGSTTLFSKTIVMDEELYNVIYTNDKNITVKLGNTSCLLTNKSGSVSNYTCNGLIYNNSTLYVCSLNISAVNETSLGVGKQYKLTCTITAI